MTRTDDPRLEGRWPEFARMSLRPGIGYGALHEVAHALLDDRLDGLLQDVPTSLRGKPLGRYLRRNLRIMMGYAPEAPQVVRDTQVARLLNLSEDGQSNPENVSLKSQVVEATKQKALNMETRQKIYTKRRAL